MLSAPAVDLEQMDKNNKKSNKKQFWRAWRPTGKFYFYCQPAYKQVVKLPGGENSPGGTDCGRWLSVTQREMKSRVYNKNSHKKEQKK